MRIVLDLQGAQAGGRMRGIGRYSMALAKEMARQASGHELHLLLNGALSESILDIKKQFDTLIPAERVKVFEVPRAIAEHLGNDWLARAAEQMRLNCIASLQPDVVHVSSLFEGFAEDFCASVPASALGGNTAVTCYDLIPLLNPEQYLQGEREKNWYSRKVQSLRNAGLVLAISEYSRSEVIDTLDYPANKVVNISSAIDGLFRKVHLSHEREAQLRARYGLTGRFVLYTGGTDARKNLEGLIAAFALLPPVQRRDLQLVIVGKEHDSSRIQGWARKRGLGRKDVVLTGFIHDTDLVDLYNLATLFILPSFHEGFGLPVLEAMACGVATLGSNRSSIPEVVGRADALFDPYQPADMAALMAKVLQDDGFRQDLQEYGLRQAKNFSWEESARRALSAFEAHYECAQSAKNVKVASVQGRRRLAYISPLPPEQSGIANYSAELLPHLACHYDITAITDQPAVSDPWIQANLPVHSVQWFEDNAEKFERVLYHFGNSHFHIQMFDLLEKYPGTVMLHDFFLSGILSHMQSVGGRAHTFTEALYRSHGYTALVALHTKGPIAAELNYPANRRVLDKAAGVIVHSEFSKQLADKWYGSGYSSNWAQVPFIKEIKQKKSSAELRHKLGLRAEDFVVCSFGLIAPTKQNLNLVSAFLQSKLGRNQNCHLVFVGENLGGEHGRDLDRTAELLRLIGESAIADRIRITGFVDNAEYEDWLAVADVAVQLRTNTRGETSAAIFDCLAYGLPLIFNAHGSAVEVPNTVGLKLADEYTREDLSAALDNLYSDAALRQQLAVAAEHYVRSCHDAAQVASSYRDAMERFAASHPRSLAVDLMKQLAELESSPPPREADLFAASVSMARNLPSITKTLYIDVSALVRHDLKTGIERVVRALLLDLVQAPPAGYRVELVYADGRHYRHAHQLAFELLSLGGCMLTESVVDFMPGDIFLGLDFAASFVPSLEDTYQALRARGVAVWFVVYDILPQLHPEWFPPEFSKTIFHPWLKTITQVADGLLCISSTVADQVRCWLKDNPSNRVDELAIKHFHLGANIAESLPSFGLSDEQEMILQALAQRQSFLMVGTMEPRKGHSQVVAAFEKLWASGVDVNLVIVGKQGWMMEGLARKLVNHPESNHRLFWLNGISDEMLLKVYQQSSALIAASQGEGFGLPLIEAAQYGLPIIARDIPVFREVAGEYAFYFDGYQPESLFKTIHAWLKLKGEGNIPQSAAMPWKTWRQSAEQLKAAVLS